ncbi:MAG: hydantoinase/carbamoylase family amidase, partial [Gallicola sp.]|nr:hydantoinase/carbamoylase family amidase [Gallicola sp.]
DPKVIGGLKDYIELHIEQGRVLEDSKRDIGIVNTIAGGIKVIVTVSGMAEHAGATPMDLRRDSLAGVSEIILEVEKIGKSETDTSVATVGFIENHPNSMNVVPGETKFSIDIRDIKNDSMENMRKKITESIEEICEKRGLDVDIKISGSAPPVELSKRMLNEFENIAVEGDYKYRIMPSGAGHDCMKMQALCDSILVFVPCKDGVSHNPVEYVSSLEMAKGASLIYEYLISKNK